MLRTPAQKAKWDIVAESDRVQSPKVTRVNGQSERYASKTSVNHSSGCGSITGVWVGMKHFYRGIQLGSCTRIWRRIVLESVIFSFSYSFDPSEPFTSLASSSRSTAMHVFAAMTNVLMGAPNVLSMCLRRSNRRNDQNDRPWGSAAPHTATITAKPIAAVVEQNTHTLTWRFRNAPMELLSWPWLSLFTAAERTWKESTCASSMCSR